MANHGPAVAVRLPATPETAFLARRLVRDASAGLPAERIDDAVIATNELVTNAVQHAGGSLTIAIERGDDAIAVAVVDGSVDRPGITPAAPVLDEGGRGLDLVAKLTDAWGCRSTPDGAGKVIWFRISAQLTGR